MNESRDSKRILECLTCECIEVCLNTISDPEEYVGGMCRTKDILKEKRIKPEQNKKSERSTSK